MIVCGDSDVGDVVGDVVGSCRRLLWCCTLSQLEIVWRGGMSDTLTIHIPSKCI